MALPPLLQKKSSFPFFSFFSLVTRWHHLATRAGGTKKEGRDSGAFKDKETDVAAKGGEDVKGGA